MQHEPRASEIGDEPSFPSRYPIGTNEEIHHRKGVRTHHGPHTSANRASNIRRLRSPPLRFQSYLTDSNGAADRTVRESSTFVISLRISSQLSYIAFVADRFPESLHPISVF